MRNSMVLAAIGLVVASSSWTTSAQATRGPESGTAYSVAEKARREELERTAREAALAAELSELEREGLDLALVGLPPAGKSTQRSFV